MVFLEQDYRRDRINGNELADRILNYTKRKDFKIEYALDIGMGDGYLTKIFLDSGALAYGIDLRNFQQYRLINADARLLPFKDQSFDLVTELFCLDDMRALQNLSIDEREKVALEIIRVLKPHGIFISVPRSLFLSYLFKIKLYQDDIWGVYQK